MEITSHILSLPAQPAFYTGPQAPNVFLVHDGGEGALIDSGFGDEKSVKERIEFLRERREVKVRHIVLTHHHFDHTSGASQLRDETGAEVVLHSDEEKFLRDWQAEIPQDIEIPAEQKEIAEQVERFRKQAAEAGPDVRVSDGDTVKVGGLTIEVVHTPGHTLGSICLYLREERALFTGDTALGLGTVAISPPPHGDMALYLTSLERLKRYDCAVMLPGHGQAVHDVPRKLQELIDHRLEREEQVMRLLADGKSTTKAMLSAIYMELDKRIVPMALRQIEAHLAKLEAEGRIRRGEEGEWGLV
ncbi:MAG TPA: MBL fold metallo-hydrolase [Dehalococcoidia bacterium]|nr:MBL fold metallo-hydrolase [Dehalococcoidia bacterium]